MEELEYQKQADEIAEESEEDYSNGTCIKRTFTLYQGGKHPGDTRYLNEYLERGFSRKRFCDINGLDFEKIAHHAMKPGFAKGSMSSSEAEKLMQDMLIIGAAELILDESPELGLIPTLPATGKTIQWRMRNALPIASTVETNSDLSDNDSTFTSASNNVAKFYSQVSIDNMDIDSAMSRNNLLAVEQIGAIRAMSSAFSLDLYKGDHSTNADEFDGLDELIPASQEVEIATNGAALSAENLDKLDEAIDKVRGGEPSVMIMARRVRRALNKILRSDFGWSTKKEGDAIGHRIGFYDGIPIRINDNYPVDETLGEGEDLTSIWILRLGLDGLFRVTLGGDVKTYFWPALESRDAVRFRMVMQTCPVSWTSLCAGRLKGIDA
jgi:hypothetical protein